MLALERVGRRLKQVRDILRTLPLPRFLSAIESVRHLLLAFFILCGTAAAIGVVIDLRRGIGTPVPIGSFAILLLIGVIAGLSEEVLFRGFAKRYLGNGGLVIGTVIWVTLHQFYAAITSFYRLPADILYGIFYLKLWRGRFWWLALVIHPTWNVASATAWQIVKTYMA